MNNKSVQYKNKKCPYTAFHPNIGNSRQTAYYIEAYLETNWISQEIASGELQSYVGRIFMHKLL